MKQRVTKLREAIRGVLGERYVGGGNSVANALTMGRVTGKTLAREISQTKPASAPLASCNINPQPL